MKINRPKLTCGSNKRANKLTHVEYITWPGYQAPESLVSSEVFGKGQKEAVWWESLTMSRVRSERLKRFLITISKSPFKLFAGSFSRSLCQGQEACNSTKNGFVLIVGWLLLSIWPLQSLLSLVETIEKRAREGRRRSGCTSSIFARHILRSSALRPTVTRGELSTDWEKIENHL